MPSWSRPRPLAPAPAASRPRSSRAERRRPGYSRTVYADAGGRAVLERWAVHGAGHAWSGGSPDGTSPTRAAPTPRAPCSASSSTTRTPQPHSRQAWSRRSARGVGSSAVEGWIGTARTPDTHGTNTIIGARPYADPHDPLDLRAPGAGARTVDRPGLRPCHAGTTGRCRPLPPWAGQRLAEAGGIYWVGAATEGAYGSEGEQTFEACHERPARLCDRGPHARAHTPLWLFLDGLTRALLGGSYDATTDRWGWSNLLKIGWSAGSLRPGRQSSSNANRLPARRRCGKSSHGCGRALFSSGLSTTSASSARRSADPRPGMGSTTRRRPLVVPRRGLGQPLRPWLPSERGAAGVLTEEALARTVLLACNLLPRFA